MYGSELNNLSRAEKFDLYDAAWGCLQEIIKIEEAAAEWHERITDWVKCAARVCNDGCHPDAWLDSEDALNELKEKLNAIRTGLETMEIRREERD